MPRTQKPRRSGRTKPKPGRLHVGAQGRLVLPVALRRLLRVKPGQELPYEVQGSTVTLRPPDEGLARLKALGRGARMPDGSLASEALMRERREEAAREEEELAGG